MLLTKDDIFIQETYSPPAGEKDISLFPRIFGGDTNVLYNYFRGFGFKAEKRERNGVVKWEISCKMADCWGQEFYLRAPLTTAKVLEAFNKPGRISEQMYRSMIKIMFEKVQERDFR